MAELPPTPRHPVLGDLPAQVLGISRRLGLTRLEQHYDSRSVLTLFVFINAAIATLVLCAFALVTHEPFMFPSLGPTAFILFVAAMDVQAAPRNVFCGHLIGVLAGYLALVIFGLTAVGPNLDDITWARAGAVTLALALTGAAMVWLGVPHAPAAATTLIVALGLIHDPKHLAILMLAVVILIIEGFAINRFAGLPVPIWSPRANSPEHPSA